MSREKVLQLLRAQEGYLSGEALSRDLSLSRAAVWKAVEGLRKDGYEIEARTGLGYRLISVPDVLTEGEIRRYLGSGGLLGCELHCLDSVDSTNTYAKKLAMQGAPEGTVVIANHQTAGRGRMGRQFQSPKDKGIYLTLLLRPCLPPARLMPVTAMAGVAVCDAVEKVCGVRPGLKWPNDPVIGKRKLCGVLTEMSLEGETGQVQYLVLGIGINMSQTAEDFTPDVAQIATSLNTSLGWAVCRSELAAALIREVERLYLTLLCGDLSEYLAAYRRDCVNLGKTVQLLGEEREVVTAVDIDEEFGLVVRTANGEEKTVRSGEVSVRGMYGYVE
ncbi:MAG: biotin--[Oscillibacter sp.]|nr:biotin--[acetyl-CoA-carboxylase] ligase [Oscillibacter sp.]